MSCRTTATLLLALTALAAPLSAQPITVPSAAPGKCAPNKTMQTLRDRPFFDPLIADPRAPQFSLAFPAVSPEFPHSVERGSRLVWDVSIGKEVAILTRSNFTDATKAAGCSGYGIWVDASFHVLEELNKDDSNPIINTDYRFSLIKLKYYRIRSVGSRKVNLGAVPTFQSWAIRADLLHHESTHLGDEYVIHAQGLTPEQLAERNERPFERFNPSHEFQDYAFAYNWEGGLGRLTTVRAGSTMPVFWKWNDGLYSGETLDPNSRPVPTSKRKFEPYAQFEHHWPHPFTREEARAGGAPEATIASLPERKKFSPFVSLDARHRIVYNFYKSSSDELEEKQLSLNLLAGLRSWSGEDRLSVKDFYARFYWGVNPHGQLRSQADYWLVGLGINFAVGDR